jgi:hypothetical protein
MKVDQQQLLNDGFIILPEVIPAPQLEALRTASDILVERQKEIWTRDRKPDEPAGGQWETGAQPRLGNYQNLIDASTANTVEVWLHENTLGVSRQLLSVPQHTSMTGMMMMCSPQRDHGPAAWHRDVHPIDMAPMASLQADLLENGPKYLQWNIPLYDDEVLWVVPGSHRRLNTAAENQQLSQDPRVPLPDGVPVELKAGDGVVYINYLLHWGSNYSTKLRRTLHGGHTIFPYCADLNFTEYLSAEARESFVGWDQKSAQMQDLTESALRAIINNEADAYRAAVEDLQPGAGKAGQIVQAIYLCKAAYNIHILKNPDDSLPDDILGRASSPHPISINWGPQFADRFSTAEAELLWQRCTVLDAKLQADEEHFVPGFQARPMHYYFDAMPSPFGVEDFIASWTASA